LPAIRSPTTSASSSPNSISPASFFRTEHRGAAPGRRAVA
jgi:hypothetical protein